MIPRSLDIKGQTYRIKHVNRKDLGKGNIAEVDHNFNIIRVYKRTAASRKIELLLHEALHAMLVGAEFKDEEAVVLILGQALTEFIKSNPVFIQYALQTLSK
jgi:hypothetical protein